MPTSPTPPKLQKLEPEHLVSTEGSTTTSSPPSAEARKIVGNKLAAAISQDK